jgi:D-sedoheptulose 7-phosphate isomerase
MNINKIIINHLETEIQSIISNFQFFEKNFCSINFVNLCLKSIEAIKNKKKIILFGNGGSAADAQHIATELTVKYEKKRRPFPAISLATDTSALTAIGNDLSFDYIFSRQVEALGNPGDIAIGISTSGNSRNVINAIKVANRMGLLTFCFLGNNGGQTKKYVKFPIIVSGNSTSIIQVTQISLAQIYCGIIEKLCK